jgi:hypothetical protein
MSFASSFLRYSELMRGFSAPAFAIGLAVIAILIGGIFYMQRGDKIDLPGKILKVRTAVLDNGEGDRGEKHNPSSVAVIDFRVTNPSDVIFEVRTVTVRMTGADGKVVDGQITSDSDAAAMMTALPVLGEKYNKTLMVKERIGAHASVDRMAAVRFEVPAAELDARKNLTIRIEEVDGKTFEYSER